MNNAENYRDLHFVRVLEDDLVQGGHLPHRVHSQRIGTLQKVLRTRIQLQHGIVDDRRFVVVDAPAGAKQIQRLGEDIVVDQTGVHREHAHQQNDVATTEEDVPDLVVRLLGR